MTVEEEKRKLKLMSEDMYCKRYEMQCEDVPYEVLTFVGGLGFSNYNCELTCKECLDMELW